jgi:hypothetical protein
MFDSGSQGNLIATDLANNIGLEVLGHINLYPLGWVNKDANIKVTKQCNIKFVVSDNFIDEVELDVVTLDICEVVFGIAYTYTRYCIFM